MDYTQNQAEERGHKKWIALLLLLLLAGSALVVVGYAYTATYNDDVEETDIGIKFLTIESNMDAEYGTDIHFEFDSLTMNSYTEGTANGAFTGTETGYALIADEGTFKVKDATETEGPVLYLATLIDNVKVSASSDDEATLTITPDGWEAPEVDGFEFVLVVFITDSYDAVIGDDVTAANLEAFMAGDDVTGFEYASEASGVFTDTDSFDTAKYYQTYLFTSYQYGDVATYIAKATGVATPITDDDDNEYYVLDADAATEATLPGFVMKYFGEVA